MLSNPKPDGHEPGILHELLYVSSLSKHVSLDAISQIASHARFENRRLGITGLLIFDGQNFCHYLEGPIEEVGEMFERICRDRRHTDVLLLHNGPANARTFSSFSLGFCDAEICDSLSDIGSLAGVLARDAFFSRCGAFDLEVNP